MPVPGPRTQFRPVEGYRNPDGEHPTRIQHWDRPAAVVQPGRSPATMARDLRDMILAAGQVRRDWLQHINLTPGSAPYSWTESAPAPGRPVLSPRGVGITRALRYMTRSVYVAGGTDGTRYTNLHTVVHPSARSKPITRGAGTRRNPPTVRNRLTSFGSRVPPINQRVSGAQQ